MLILPERIKPERLQELVTLIRSGHATKSDRDEVILGHSRLAISVANQFARRHRNELDECRSVALHAVVLAVKSACDKLTDDNIMPWIFSIIRNQLRMYLRSLRHTTEKVKDRAVKSSCEAEVLQEINSLALHEHDKEILELRYAGYSDSQIGEMLNLSRPVVQRLRARIVRNYERVNT